MLPLARAGETTNGTSCRAAASALHCAQLPSGSIDSFNSRPSVVSMHQHRAQHRQHMHQRSRGQHRRRDRQVRPSTAAHATVTGYTCRRSAPAQVCSKKEHIKCSADRLCSMQSARRKQNKKTSDSVIKDQATAAAAVGSSVSAAAAPVRASH